jgi:hypothetical protein
MHELIAFLENVIDTTKKRLFAAGAIKIVTATVTRRADTTQYAINDVVCNSTSKPSVIVFSNVARVADCGGRITGAKLTKDNTSVTSALFRLYLYNDKIDAIADNLPHKLLAANAGKRLGYIDFSMQQTSGAGSDCVEDVQQGLNLEFVTTNNTQSLYGLLVALATYTPASGEVFTVELRVEQY